jgi:hypothetical protein
VKLLGDRGQREDNQEKVERVECPAEEAGEDGGAVTTRGRVSNRGWADRV